jgi:hypothetical protein
LAEDCAPRVAEAGFQSTGIYPSIQMSYWKLPSLQSAAERPLCCSVSRSQEAPMTWNSWRSWTRLFDVNRSSCPRDNGFSKNLTNT